MIECPACKHRDYAFLGTKHTKIGDDFIVISRDLGLVACPECNCVIYEWSVEDKALRGIDE